MKQQLSLDLLKQVSRSFYLSLRLLPGPMRRGAGLAYMLARATDTIADSSAAGHNLRIQCLDEFSSQLEAGTWQGSWPTELVMAVEDSSERELLTKSHRIHESLLQLPEGELMLIQKVLRTIIAGQRFDLELFGQATRKAPVALSNRSQLDDYTYKVAGCVGEFWTRLGFETLGDRFSDGPEDELCDLGRAYGKGLQLVNVLRDMPTDLDVGRCYLPVKDPHDHELLLNEHRFQWAISMKLVQQGLEYSSRLKSRRLRMASVMPALLAEDTLALMKQADWRALASGIKISRRQVYGSLMQSLLY